MKTFINIRELLDYDENLDYLFHIARICTVIMK